MKKPTPQERLDALTERSADGCWNFTGPLLHGYGRLYYKGKTRAHQVAYLLNRGDIPDGMAIHHRCFNKLCVNPDHLELLTESEHSRLHGARVTCCKRGHLLDETNAHIDPKSGKRSCKICRYDRSRQWLQKNRDRANSYSRAWCARNRDKVREYHVRWYGKRSSQ